MESPGGKEHPSWAGEAQEEVRMEKLPLLAPLSVLLEVWDQKLHCDARMCGLCVLSHLVMSDSLQS